MWNEFLREIKITKRESTYENYKNALKHFQKGNKEEVLVFISKTGLSESSKKLYLNVLGSALEYYDMETKDIKRIISNYRANTTIEPCPTDKEVEMVWESCKTARDRLIFGLMAYAGLRVSEVQALTMDCIINGNKIVLKGTKGKHDAIVTLVHPRILEAMQEYLADKPWCHDKDNPLFVTNRHQGMTLEGMMFMIKRNCVKLNLPYHPHSFRRYFGNTLSRKGLPLQLISRAMRHKNVKTTMGYLNISQEDVASALKGIYKEED